MSFELDGTERLHFHFSLSRIGKGNGNPLQCSCLENPRDGGAWWAGIYGIAQSRTWLKRLSSSRMSFRIMYSIPFCGLFLLWYHNVLINLVIYFILILGKMNLLLSSSLWFFSVTKVIFVKESDLPHFFFSESRKEAVSWPFSKDIWSLGFCRNIYILKATVIITVWHWDNRRFQTKDHDQWKNIFLFFSVASASRNGKKGDKEFNRSIQITCCIYFTKAYRTIHW